DADWAWARVANGSVERPDCVPAAAPLTYHTRLLTVTVTAAGAVAAAAGVGEWETSAPGEPGGGGELNVAVAFVEGRPAVWVGGWLNVPFGFRETVPPLRLVASNALTEIGDGPSLSLSLPRTLPAVTSAGVTVEPVPTRSSVLPTALNESALATGAWLPWVTLM